MLLSSLPVKDQGESVHALLVTIARIGQKRPGKRYNPCTFPLEKGILFVKFVREGGRGCYSQGRFSSVEELGPTANLAPQANPRCSETIRLALIPFT